MPTILVVDDDKQIARLIRSYLEQAGFQVIVAYDGETALHALRRERPDLVVLDLMLPDRDGWDVTRIVRGDPTLAGTPIIMVTARWKIPIGSSGWSWARTTTWPSRSTREIVARCALCCVERPAWLPRRCLLQAGGSSKGSGQALILDPDRHEATLAGQPLDLTPMEFDLLHALMASPGHAFTRAELIERALGYTYEGMDRTVDSHIKNLRRKIEPDPADPTFIQTVYGVGYRFQGEGS